MHRFSKRAVLVVAVVVAVLATFVGATAGASAPANGAPLAATPNAASATPLTKILNSLKGLSTAKREKKLVDLAKNEGGTLEWYTSLSSLISKPVAKAFEDEYGLKVNLYRASSEAVTQRIYQEAKAGSAGADVVETNGTEMFFFQHEKNILIPYKKSPYRSGVAKAYRFDAWTADRIEAFVVAWNTKLVPSGQQPKSFQDLTDSKWKGKISMEPGDVDWYAGLYTYLQKKKHLSAKKINALFRGIAQNSKVVSGHTTQANLLAAGQYSVIVSAHAQSLEQLQAKNAPVAFSPFVQPVLLRPQGVGIVYRLRHPATALLFYDWLLSKKGQAVLLKNGVEPARRGFEDAALRGAKKIPIDLRPILRHYKAWSDKYDALIRLAKG